MKKIKFFTTLILLLGILMSCSDDFLEKLPIAATDESLFEDEEKIDALLVGTYAIVGNAYGQSGINWGATPVNWTYGSAASDDAYKGSEEGDQIPINELVRWNVSTTNSYPPQKWTWTFMGVTRANQVLKTLRQIEDISSDKAVQVEAEARWLRAYYNFESWLLFKNIPIITETTEEPEKVPNNGDVLAHIIDDLTFGINNLPETQQQIQRPTKYAAMALAAKAYMMVLDYNSAKPLLDAIINSGRFSLAPYFHDNFKIETNNNVESIWEIQAAVNDGSSGSFNADMGLGLNWPLGDLGFNSGFHQPSQNLVNAYKVDESGLPMFETFNDTDLANDYGIKSAERFVPFEDEVDPRLDWTVGRRGIPYFDWGVCRGNDWIRYQPDGGPYLPAKKTFFYKHERGTLSTTSGWQSGVNANNFRYLRFGHILLWRAEIYAFDNELDKAEEIINLFRERANKQVVMGRITTYELPPETYPWNVEIDWDLPAANYKVSPYPIGTFRAKGRAYAMKAVQWEIRLELATEGLRFFDLRRWDNLPPDLNSQPMKETLEKFAENDQRLRPFMRGVVFTEKAKYMPIPQSQIDLQPGILVQNPGY